jgi:hypothetical protein
LTSGCREQEKWQDENSGGEGDKDVTIELLLGSNTKDNENDKRVFKQVVIKST